MVEHFQERKLQMSASRGELQPSIPIPLVEFIYSIGSKERPVLVAGMIGCLKALPTEADTQAAEGDAIVGERNRVGREFFAAQVTKGLLDGVFDPRQIGTESPQDKVYQQALAVSELSREEVAEGILAIVFPSFRDGIVTSI